MRFQPRPIYRGAWFSISPRHSPSAPVQLHSTKPTNQGLDRRVPFVRRELQIFESERERSSSKQKAKLLSGTELGRKDVDGVRETVETSDMGSCGPGGVSVYLLM